MGAWARRPSGSAHASLRGFTLVELLIVVVILGVLAAIVIPRFAGHSEEAKQAALDQSLAILQEAIERYALEHGGRYPGTLAGETSWGIFVKQMTLPTDATGDTGTRYGPCLRTGIPRNPFTGTNNGTTSKVLAIGVAVAWRYDPTSGAISAGSSGGSPEPKADPTPIEP